MKQKKLILTPTKAMDRMQWLAFRTPVFHVGSLLEREIGFNPKFLTPEFKDEERYQTLITFFKESEVWQKFIFPCIGGSEMATIMGLNEYKASIELFYEKVGVIDIPDFDNIAMFWGRELEAQVAEKWQYWDGTEETLIDNFKNGRIIRKNRRINAYMQNVDFPYIFVSIDRIINKGTQMKEGSLECKTISGYAADKWEAGIPPMYLIQNQTQLLVPEFDFGEIAILRDGRHFDVIPFDRNDSICDTIKNKAKLFYESVKSAIEFYFLSLGSPTEELRLLNLHHIDGFAPEPDSSISYENYLKRKPDDGYTVTGTIIEHQICKDFQENKMKAEEYVERQRECSNKIKAYMAEASTMIFDKEPSDNVTWRANKNGVRVFKINLKS